MLPDVMLKGALFALLASVAEFSAASKFTPLIFSWRTIVMKRLFLVLIVLSIAVQSISAEEVKVVKKKVPAPTTVAKIDGSDENVEARKISFRQRRKLGITVRNMARAAKELKAEGIWDSAPEKREEMSQLILSRLIDEDPQAWMGEAPQIDFEGLIAFIERLIPLILQLMEIFGKFAGISYATPLAMAA